MKVVDDMNYNECVYTSNFAKDVPCELSQFFADSKKMDNMLNINKREN